jgi:hypothetical protein
MSEAENGGYGRPPRRTRFQPGQSGNPRGRPKGARSTGTIVTGLLNRKVSLTSAGQRRQVPLKEAIIMRMAEAALKGDLKAAAALFALAGRGQALAESAAGAAGTEPALTSHEQADKAIIASFLARQAPEPPSGE